MNIGIGVDVGGTHITAAAIDLESKQILKESIITTSVNNQDNALHIISTFYDTIVKSGELSRSDNISCIGIAMPGPFDYMKGFSKIQGVNKYDNIFGLSFKPYFSSGFPDFNVNKISFLNDADCFLCGEYWLKDLSKYRNIVGITLGTGFGSSYIKKEKPDSIFIKSLHTGFFYKIPYGDSIANDYICTGWLVKRWKEVTGEDVQGVKEIAEKAETDQIARNVFHEFGYNLTELLMPKLEKLNAEILIIGGNIAKANKYFLNVLKDRIKEKSLKTEIIISTDTANSALCGAAYWALESSKQISDFRHQTSDISILADRIAKEKTVIIDGYNGINWEDFCEKIERDLRERNLKTCWWSIEAGLEEDEDIETKIAKSEIRRAKNEKQRAKNNELSADNHKLSNIFNSEYLKKIKPDNSADINIIYGCGASLLGWKGFKVYLDTAMDNIKLLNEHKEKILSNIDLIYDLRF